MFPSNNRPNEFKYVDHSMFFTDVIPNSFHFYPTFPDHNNSIFQHHHLQNQELLCDHLPQQLSREIVTNMEVSTNNHIHRSGSGCSSFPPNKKNYSTTAKIPRKGSGKKDRHSKIVTSRGPRDRRMRLSLDIAHRFFNLQDILGFDKASKTIDWLLTKSKEAIKELSRGFPQCKHSSNDGAKSVSPISECEVAFEIDKGKGKSLEAFAKDKKIKDPHKSIFHPLSKESRAKARARARERTFEKMLSRKLDKTERSKSSHSNDTKSSLEVVAEAEQRISHSQHQGPIENMIEESSMITKSSSSIISNYHYDVAMPQGVSSNFSFPNFHENWGIDGRGMDIARTYPSYHASTNMHLSTDIQFYAKSRDHYNNPC